MTLAIKCYIGKKVVEVRIMVSCIYNKNTRSFFFFKIGRESQSAQEQKPRIFEYIHIKKLANVEIVAGRIPDGVKSLLPLPDSLDLWLPDVGLEMER